MRRSLTLFFCSLLALTTLSCSESSEPMEPENTDQFYVGDYRMIDNLMTDLKTAWERRELDRYAELLSHDFVFIFQVAEAGGIPNGYWGKADELAGVKAIFDSPQVTEVSIDLTLGDLEDSSLTAVTEEEAHRHIAFDSLVELEINDGPTEFVSDGDIHWFFFQMGDAEHGEDPARWYLVEWQDLGSPQGSTENTSIGRMKQLFR